MAACVLLLEITKFIREPPPDFASFPNHPAHPVIQVSTTTPMSSGDRKFSNLSILSTDSDSSRLAVSPVPPFVPPIRRLSSEQQLRHSTGISLEDIPKFRSVDQQQLTDQQPSQHLRKLSVYLRVNSRYGRPNRVAHPSLFPKTPEATPDPHRLASPNHSPLKANNRRMSMSVAALKQASAGAHDVTGSTTRRLPRRSVAFIAHPSSRRRMSVAANFSVHDHARKETSPNPVLNPHAYSRQGSVPGTGKGIGSPSNRRHRPSVFNKVARKFAFRQRGKQEHADKKKLSTTTQASSTGSTANSPNLSHRRTIMHHLSSHTETLNDLQTNLPWLDIVEHLAAASNSPSPAINLQRRKACLELIAALEKIYGGEVETQSESNLESSSAGSPVKGAPSLTRPMYRNSISTAFSDSMGSDTRHLLSPSLARSATGTFRRFIDFHRALASLNFTGVRLTTFMVPGNDNVDLTMDELLEQDSAQDAKKIQYEHSRERLQYIQQGYAGLLHAPFSLLTYAAPLLTPSDFMQLKEVAWEMLLDSDQELADAAGKPTHIISSQGPGTGI